MKDIGVLKLTREEIDALPAGKSKTKNGIAKCKDKTCRHKRDQEEKYNFYINNFGPPKDLKSTSAFQINENFIYEQLDINTIGSMIFNGNSIPSDPQKITNYEGNYLLIRDFGDQLQLLNPIQSNNYRLNVNHASLMKKALDAKAGGGGGFLKIVEVQAAAVTALKKTLDEKKRLSIFYGKFENSLASYFNLVSNGRIKRDGSNSNAQDFLTLYNLWIDYSNDPTIYDGKSVLWRFQSMIIDERSDIQLIIDNKFEAESELKVNSPFINVNSSASYNWQKKRDFGASYNVSKVLIDEKSIVMEPIPSPEKILETWNRIKNKPEIKFSEGNRLVVNDFTGNDTEIKIPFGPVTEETVFEVKAEIVGDSKFIRDFKVLKDDKHLPKKLPNNMYELSVKVNFHNNKIQNDLNIRPIIPVQATLGLFFDRSVKFIDSQGNESFKKLEVEYPLNITLKTGPRAKANVKSNHIDSIRRSSWDIEIITDKKVEHLEIQKLKFPKNPELNSYGEDILFVAKAPKLVENSQTKWKLKLESDFSEMNFERKKTIAELEFIFFDKNLAQFKRKSRVDDFIVKGTPNDSTDALETRIAISDISKIPDVLPETLMFNDTLAINEIFKAKGAKSKPLKLKALNKLIDEKIIERSKDILLINDKKKFEKNTEILK